MKMNGRTSDILFCFFCPLPQKPLDDSDTKIVLVFLKKEIFNFKIINVNVLSICCIFLLPLCFFFY